jgi:hypothetical protein
MSFVFCKKSKFLSNYAKIFQFFFVIIFTPYSQSQVKIIIIIIKQSNYSIFACSK